MSIGTRKTTNPTVGKVTSSGAKNLTFNINDYVRDGVDANKVAEVHESFILFDTDGEGAIDLKELKSAMVSLGFDTRNKAVFDMINELDQDKSGKIDFQEYLDLMTHRVSAKDSREALNKVFKLYDEEGKGYISQQDLRRVAKVLGSDADEPQLLNMFKTADLDHDSKVSEDEFYNIITRRTRY